MIMKRVGRMQSFFLKCLCILCLGLGYIYSFSQNAAFADTIENQLKRPVVVELFTSQGCNSCPPAEAYLGRLADRENIIALEFHVDYWDYIGWKDPFADSAFNNRQKAYVKPLGMRYIYTPQMVINGQEHEVGSREKSVEVAIDQALTKQNGPLPIIEVLHAQDELIIHVSANGYRSLEAYDILVISFDERHETKITRGENRGKTAISSNVVRDINQVGDWSGKDQSMRLEIANLAGTGGCAVILQKKGGGEILAAAMLSLNT